MSSEKPLIFDIEKAKIPVLAAITIGASVVGGFFTAYITVFSAIGAISTEANAGFTKANEVERNQIEFKRLYQEDRVYNKAALDKLVEKTTKTETMVELMYHGRVRSTGK